MLPAELTAVPGFASAAGAASSPPCISLTVALAVGAGAGFCLNLAVQALVASILWAETQVTPSSAASWQMSCTLLWLRSSAMI